jgi:site-specific DNA-methyltransferase (adenine-specific)
MNIIYNQDCLIGIKDIPDNSIDMCLTDPPYFLDSLDDEWDLETITKKLDNDKGTIKSLPKGMKFDPSQGIKFQEFYAPLCVDIHRVLKPGGFFLSFSATRLYHRMTIAMEDAGFEIRDMIGWTYEGQAKAFSPKHFIKKNPKYSEEEKASMIEEMDGWKTPQLKPCVEPICVAQKATEGTYVDNWLKWGVGLMDSRQSLDGKFPGNIIPMKKPTKDEKGHFNNHLSVKPLKLCDHLISLYTRPGQVVLDPFMGSGTTAVSAIRTKRQYVGYEKSNEYHKICMQRIQMVTPDDDGFFV